MIDAYTKALAAAHRGDAAPLSPSIALPQSLAEAMQVQRDVARALDARIAGWKVGFSPDRIAVAGPLYADMVQRSPARRGLPPRGFIVEIELAFRLGHDLPRGPYSREAILDAAEVALVGIELIHGRFGEPPAAPFLAFAGDNLGNAGYVTGDATSDFRSLDLRALACRFTIDGRVAQEGATAHPQGDPVEPLRAYAEAPIDALGGLRKGQVITTGSLTRPLRVDSPGRLEASLDGIGSVALVLER